ncbi:DUF1488 family protein [Neoroseomonas oryzicola]|uniref:DUF1488 domain-containing protein n=1 Tax=Neoroseomonas oryzicola TaxID=535904 RepID=A0A9X9WLY4_9PROT|nr:DUF1488 family protein [Neoroseomonas oryzicola]MBR0661344.1 DUF1488 domain-containing protein [Neoroseomonas oryzicola]NKE18834.1 DUF1488 domain-containing protein [Neoroseomonas oryzicola]
MIAPNSPAARWDGHRVLFALSMKDGTSVRCAISRLALLDISGGGQLKTDDILRRFSISRSMIEAAARAKLRQRVSPPIGLLHIWEDDVLDPEPPSTAPRAMRATRLRA